MSANLKKPAKRKSRKARSAIPKGGDDDVMTPDNLALLIVKHFNPDPRSRIIEPCAGTGAFVRAFKSHGIHNITTCEIKEGKDFLTLPNPAVPFDWLITNPPWSKFRPFLSKALEVADNIVFLDKLNAWMSTRKRMNLIHESNFEFVEIALVDQPPPPWPQMGFQFAAVHIRRRQRPPLQVYHSHLGHIRLSRL